MYFFILNIIILKQKHENYVLSCPEQIVRWERSTMAMVTQPVLPDPQQNQIPDLTPCLCKSSQHHQLPAQRDPAGTSLCDSRSWESHWFHLPWKVLHTSPGVSAAFVQETFRLDTHYLHTKKCILQPWITKANSPVLRHYLLGSSYHLAVKDVIRYRYETITHSRDISLWL